MFKKQKINTLKNIIIKYLDIWYKQKEINYKAYNSSKNKKFIFKIILFMQIILFILIVFFILYKVYFSINNYIKYFVLLFILIIAIIILYTSLIDKTKYIDYIKIKNNKLIIKVINDSNIYEYDLDRIKIDTNSIPSNELFLIDNFKLSIKNKKHKDYYLICPSKDDEKDLWAFLVTMQIIKNNIDFNLLKEKELKRLYKKIF